MKIVIIKVYLPILLALINLFVFCYFKIIHTSYVIDGDRGILLLPPKVVDYIIAISFAILFVINVLRLRRSKSTKLNLLIVIPWTILNILLLLYNINHNAWFPFYVLDRT